MRSENYYKTNYDSPIGNITLVCDGKNLVGLRMGDQKYFDETGGIELSENNDLEIFRKTENWLTGYFKGKRPEINALALAPKGNEFKQNVWRILCEIPYGTVLSYGDIAKKIAHRKGLQKMSARAVGGAVGRNPIPIIIPCHRVVGANGDLTGYAGGIKIKIELLKHEGVNTAKLFTHKNTSL